MNIDSHHCAFYDIPVLFALIPLLKKYRFESVRYIGNSYFNGTWFRKKYGKYWIETMDKTGLRHVNYSSSVATYDKNMKKRSPKLICEKNVEVYVHPVLIGDHLIDNYTGGTHLKESFHRTGLAKKQFITSKDI